MISTYYGNWDYWEFYHKVTFDGPNRLILINPGETVIDIQEDIYSAWKEWSLRETNSQYLQALNTVGGEPTVAGQFLDVTYFLINGWKIKPYSGEYSINLVGNIFDIDGGDIKVPADINHLYPNNISINTNTSVIVRLLKTDSGSGTYSLAPDERAALFNIEDTVVEIRNILEQPVQATLVPSQESALLDIQEKIAELWKLHGLDPNNDLIVNQDGRIVDGIIQEFDKQPDGTIKVTRI